MGKQINYWLGYEDFLPIAQTALDCGCVIIKRSADGKLVYGDTLSAVTEDVHRYYFYVREAGELEVRKLDSGRELIGGYNSSGNLLIEAGFSHRHDREKQLTRSRLFVISGYYDEEGAYIARPDCVTRVYNKLVRVAKKAAPYTELTDSYDVREGDGMQAKEWRHKEYVSPEFLRLRQEEGYSLC